MPQGLGGGLPITFQPKTRIGNPLATPHPVLPSGGLHADEVMPRED